MGVQRQAGAAGGAMLCALCWVSLWCWEGTEWVSSAKLALQVRGRAARAVLHCACCDALR